MRNAGVVADEAEARLQPPRQFGQRQALRQFKPVRGKDRRQTAQPSHFCFAPHQEKAEPCRGLQMVDEAHPVFFRPVFPFAAAARMKRELVES